jgi:DNA-directed RNA polymerase specialized sigma24 family protein
VNESAPLTLAELIDSLPEEERVVLMLHFVRNFSIKEIAAAIGAPERAVLSVLTSGRARLQASLNFPSPD